MSTIYTVNNKVLKNSANDKWLTKKEVTPVDPWNPLNLPANTIRVKFYSGYTPTMGDTQTLVDSTNNVWDIYKSSNNWGALFNTDDNDNLLEVLGANTTNVTNMAMTFGACDGLTTIPLFDTSSVVTMEEMFANCSHLTSIPLFNTSNVTNMNYTFYGCIRVETGALALYQQASTQANPPSDHTSTFYDCGVDTVTGAAELAQIPESWKEE